MAILLYNQPKPNDFIGHCSTPWNKTPLMPNTCINIVNFMWEWGLVSRGEGTMFQRQKTENVAIWSKLFYIYYVLFAVSAQFFFCTKSGKFLSFFLSLFDVFKKLSISISFSRFSVFLHILKSPATIVYPCITLILFFRIPILLSDLLLLGYITSCK